MVRYSMVRKFLLWFLILVVAGFAMLVGAYYLAKKYEEPVREYIIGEVNKRLEAPVHVSDINFSILERFPSASLVMDSVWAEENIVKIGNPDTLLFFEKVYLNLNIFDMLDGQYKINEIETRDGFIRLRVDDQGYDNYRIWKTSDDTTGFLLELDKVHIQNGHISYINEIRQQDINVFAEELWFNGSFSKSKYTMVVKGNGLVDHFRLKQTDYLIDREVAVQSELDIETESETYAFNDGRLLIDNVLDFKVAGKFLKDGIDLRIVGNDLDIIKSISLLPGESRSVLKDYSSSGILDFDCTLIGAFGRTENPRLQAKFSFDNATIKKKGTNWELSELTGSGQLDNGEKKNMESTKLVLNNLIGEINNSPFASAFSVSNFKQPTITGSARINTDIAALDEFFNIDGIDSGKGQISIDAEISTTLLNPSEPQARDFLNAKAKGQIRIGKSAIKLKDDERLYQVDSARFDIQNNALVISSYKGYVNDTKVELDGRANDFLNYLFTDDGVLSVSGNIKTGDIDLQALFPQSSNASHDGGVVVAFPKRSNWNLNIISDKFVNGKFVAEEVSGHLRMDASVVEASRLHFVSQGGQVKGSAGIFQFSENQYGLRTNFESENIDINQLFETFNNFDQSFIRSEHLSGRAQADVQFTAMCDSVLTINTKSIISKIDLTIHDGAIKGFEPLISVADEIKKKPMLRLFVSTDELKKRLENVQFATLQNEISIRNGVINIPQMAIQSSAIDLNISGTHTFDNEIDYAMDFALSELLELKNRTEPYNEFVQRDQKGRTRLYLTMVGTTDDFEVNLEKTNLQSSIKDEMRNESNTVKNLLKEEFQKSRSDSSGMKAEQPEIEIEFDPEAGLNQENSQKSDVQKPAKDNKKGGLKGLIKKAESDKKKLGDGDFEDDDF